MTATALALDAASLPTSGKARQILDAAKRVFMQHGYGAASMDMVAREAGVSKATLYAHYTSKERLFALMVNETCLIQSNLLEPGVLDTLDFEEALHQIGTRFLNLLLSPEALAIHRVVVGEKLRFPELGKALFEFGPSVMLARLSALLTRGIEGAAIPSEDVMLAAQQFIGLLKGELHLRAILHLQTDFSEAQKRRVVDAAVRVFTAAYPPRRS